jgi:hypothetical protein
MPEATRPSYRWQDALAFRSEQHPIELASGKQQQPLQLQLQRFGAPSSERRSTRHVLLVHGASAGSRTFMVPDGGLVQHLIEEGWDVWTLDWRGSNLFAKSEHRSSARKLEVDKLSAYADLFDLDYSAREDLPAAIEVIARRLEEEGSSQPLKLSIVAHCIGGAVTAQAIGGGSLDAYRGDGARRLRIDNIVMTTLALFYRVSVDGWLKGNDHMLEALLGELGGFGDPDHPVISPWAASETPSLHTPWPESLENMYALWKRSPMPHGCGKEFCNRASFMFGMPYRVHDLEPLHEAAEPEGLWAQFGNMPLKLYMHCVRNLRRGFAAPYDEDAASQWDGRSLACDDGSHEEYVRAEKFVGSGREQAPWAITLITGAENQVWHRDSIDRMHEWLLNQARDKDRPFFEKHVLSGYGHQDLYWSTKAKVDVYKRIVRGLRRYAEASRAART